MAAPPPAVLPGMVALVRFQSSEASSGLCIPRRCLINDSVYVVSDGKAAKRAIKLLADQGDQVVVSGLSSSDQIISLLQAQNDLTAGGSLDIEGDSNTIDVTGAFTSLQQIRELPLLVTPAGQQLRLGDLGRVRYGYQDPHQTLTRVNGKQAVAVSVVMKTGKNVIELGRQVERELKLIRADLPAGVDLVTVQDQPREVNQRVDLFLANLRDGIWLVVLFVVLLLGLRAALPIAIAIPLNMVCTFAVLSLLGTDLQQMSIAALIIGLGMIVDDAVVVTDNIRRYILLGHSPKDAAVKATAEVAVPVFTSTLTTVFGLLMSTLLTMFVVPLLFTAIAGKAALKLSQRSAEEQ